MGHVNVPEGVEYIYHHYDYLIVYEMVSFGS